MALEKFPDEPGLISLQGMMHARRGEVGAALDCVGRPQDLPIGLGHAHHTYHQIACIYAVLGENKPFFLIDPYLENLRPEPRFQQLVAALEREFMGLRINKL